VPLARNQSRGYELITGSATKRGKFLRSGN
jgi:hypothetical protein